MSSGHCPPLLGLFEGGDQLRRTRTYRPTLYDAVKRCNPYNPFPCIWVSLLYPMQIPPNGFASWLAAEHNQVQNNASWLAAGPCTILQLDPTKSKTEPPPLPSPSLSHPPPPQMRFEGGGKSFGLFLSCRPWTDKHAIRATYYGLTCQ